MKGQDILFSSVKDDWETPDWLYTKLNNEFHFDFDPCPHLPKFDGLAIEWGNTNFVNPPYGRNIKAWMQKGYNEWKKGKTIVYLIHARTDTKWFHEFVYPYAELRFLKGRVKFKGAKSGSPFPSMIAILKAK